MTESPIAATPFLPSLAANSGRYLPWLMRRINRSKPSLDLYLPTRAATIRPTDLDLTRLKRGWRHHSITSVSDDLAQWIAIAMVSSCPRWDS